MVGGGSAALLLDIAFLDGANPGRDLVAPTQRAKSKQRHRSEKPCRWLGNRGHADIVEKCSAHPRCALAREGQHSARRRCGGIKRILHVIAAGGGGSIEER
jgi:hypothetical protein